MSLDAKIHAGDDGGLPSSDHLMYAFGSFRPSERGLLSGLFAQDGGEDLVLDAFRKYMEVWAEADWLEEYNVQKIAIWMSVNAPETLVSKVRTLAQQNVLSNASNRKLTYSVFLNELEGRLSRA